MLLPILFIFIFVCVCAGNGMYEIFYFLYFNFELKKKIHSNSRNEISPLYINRKIINLIKNNT